MTTMHTETIFKSILKTNVNSKFVNGILWNLKNTKVYIQIKECIFYILFIKNKNMTII